VFAAYFPVGAYRLIYEAAFWLNKEEIELTLLNYSLIISRASVRLLTLVLKINKFVIGDARTSDDDRLKMQKNSLANILYEEDFCMPYLIIGVILILIPVIWWISVGNGFKRKEIKINEALSGIEVALTKRYDMLTKLLDVTKGYVSHEKELFSQVIQLRRGMSVDEINEKNAELDALGARIYAVAENYPELRSAEIFRELQAGIRDAEEHLQAARRLYNSNVTAFNTAVDIFPSSIVAKSRRLQKHEFFVAEAVKREDVKMNF